MTTEFVAVPADWKVADALAHLQKVASTKETIYAIYVVSPGTHHLDNVVSLRELLQADPNATLRDIRPKRKVISISPEEDRGEAARRIGKYNLLALPVLDENHDILGIVTVDDVIDAMVADQTNEVQRLGAVEALDLPYRETSLATMIKKRAGWLSALFLGEMLTATAMGYFEKEIERAVVLSLFIPLIISSEGNSGSQATSLIIRALAVRELTLRDWWRVAMRELPSGLILGGILGVIGTARVLLWQTFGWYDYGPHYLLVAMTVGISLVGVVTFGAMAGSMLPFVLRRLGFDPATASAPFVATLVDVTGLVIYFTVAMLILRGTLL
jgi:magnesium transporter